MRSSPATLRSGALAAQGFALLRFTKDELCHNLEGCWKRSI
jgi:very-short-patch-repair endonuclease